jgi:ribonucleotide monophosphatase NagD (HAD superfamily)
LTLAEEVVDLVVLARDRRFTYARLARAAEAVRRGASLIATNPDRTHPGPEGAIVPETGALLAALIACVGPIAHRIVGKPEPALFEAGLARLGVAAHEAVMIGDNEETDGLGARRLGLRFVKVEEGPGGRAPRLVPLFGDYASAALQIGD